MKKLTLMIFICLLALSFQHTRSQWIQQIVPVNKPITGIKFIDSLRGWAIADIATGGPNYSYILHTTNGGTNWLKQDSSFGASLLALSVVDSNFIYCGGFDGAATANLYKTTNGGTNWFVIPTPANMSIFDMHFLNKDSGWTVGASVGADVRTTTNGGINWIVRTNGIAAQTQRLFFLNYNTGYCGANSNLYKTTNAGLNWNLLYNSPDGVFSVFFFNETIGWIGAANDKIYFTVNAGLNWQQQITPPFAGTTTDIIFINPQTGWAGNRSTYIFKTTNNGINWGYQRDTSRSFRISILNNNYGWSGDNGISRTTNGGGNITYVGINFISTEIPISSELYQNYPNPFNPATKFKFQISKSSHTKIIIYDALGRVIKTEISNILRAGTYEVDFNGSDLPSGIYFYTIITEGYHSTRKMMLIK